MVVTCSLLGALELAGSNKLLTVQCFTHENDVATNDFG